jgi:hypothetical protein
VKAVSANIQIRALGDKSVSSRSPEKQCLGQDALLSWADREIDMGAVRRFFIRRIALEAIEELKREQKDVR